MPAISTLACHAYYRLRVEGGRVPEEGPVLLVANHTNSLIDPAMMVVAAERAVRFLAKAPLFKHRLIGWLVRAVGSVPVYRRSDDPRLVSQNFESFRDVHAALAEGYALAIFPEGTSHSAAHLQPLKTGAARIALGAAARTGRAFPIVPLGLVFRDRRTFRSSARVIVGASCAWDDLAARGPRDKEAVRELMRRIEASMREVTLNLHDWSDAQLVRCAERIWTAEFGRDAGASQEIDRLRHATEALGRLRLGTDPQWRTVVRELRAHDRVLQRLGLTPITLPVTVSSTDARRWVLRRLPLLLVLPLAALGLLLFWIPRELTGWAAGRASKSEGEDTVPTYRVLYGVVIFTAWFLVLAIAASFTLGALGGLLVFMSLPLIGFGALFVGESRQLSWVALRRFFVLRLQRERIAKLRVRQRRLAARLRELFERSAG
jgi:1-acyl-sn-glycerol-3-phosphate acyltransferase